MWTSTRGEGVRPMWTHVDRGEGDQKRDFFVDVINGWPLTYVGPSAWSRLPRSLHLELLSPSPFQLRKCLKLFLWAPRFSGGRKISSRAAEFGFLQAELWNFPRNLSFS